MSKFIRLCVIAVGVLLLSAVSYANRIEPRDFSSLVAEANTIIKGKCISTTKGMDGKTPVDIVVFNVTEVTSEDVKGSIPLGEFTFKQIRASDPAESGRTIYLTHKPGPEYKAGEEYVLLLARDAKSGVYTPVGFGQGQFQVVTKADGGRAVVNPFGNRWIFDNVAVKEQGVVARQTEELTRAGASRQAADLDAFMGVMRNYVLTRPGSMKVIEPKVKIDERPASQQNKLDLMDKQFKNK